MKQVWQLLSGLLIILLMLWLGQLLSQLTGDVMPGSIIGMILLALSLQLKLIRLHWVEHTANQFIRWMSLLFVPIGVGLVDQLAVLQSAAVAIVVTCVAATLVLMALVGWGVQWQQRPKDES